MHVILSYITYILILFSSVDANFYSMNLLMIGKTHLRMKNYSAAKGFLVKARDYPVVTPDDKKVCMWTYIHVFCTCFIKYCQHAFWFMSIYVHDMQRIIYCSVIKMHYLHVINFSWLWIPCTYTVLLFLISFSESIPILCFFIIWLTQRET